MDLIIRSKVPAIYDARGQKSGIIAVEIFNWIDDKPLQRYKAKVKDSVVTDIENPTPGGPLKMYSPIVNNDGRHGNPKEKDVVRPYDIVDQIFKGFNEPIAVTDNYNDQNQLLRVRGLLLDTQQNPIYGLGPDDWEIIDRETEVAPIPEA